MKQLLEFENWASDIVHNSIFEKKDDTIKREIPKQQDIVFQAQRKYPDRDVDQALSLFLADKLDDFDKRDLQQNQVINAQRRENEKLKTNFTALQQELDDIETGSAQTDAEVKRLKQLSGQLKTDIETRRVSSDEIRDVLAQVELLKNKPGMDPKQYDQLKQQVEDFKNSRVDPEKFEKVSAQLNDLAGKETVDAKTIEKLQLAVQSIQTRQDSTGNLDVPGIQKQLQTVLNRQEQIEKEAGEIQNAKAIVDKMQNDYANLSSETEKAREVIANLSQQRQSFDQVRQEINQSQELLQTLQNTAAEIDKKKAEVAQQIDTLSDIRQKVKGDTEAWRQTSGAKNYRRAVEKRSKQARNLIKNFLDKEFPEAQNKIQSKVQEIEQAKDELNHELQLVANYAIDIQDLKRETRSLRKSMEMMSNALNSMSGAGEEIDYFPVSKPNYRKALTFDELMASVIEKNKSSEAGPSVTESYKMNYSHKKSNFIMEEMPEIGNHSVSKWYFMYQELRSKYGDNIEQIPDPRDAEIVKDAPKLSRYFWENVLTERQRIKIQEDAKHSEVVIKNALLGVCTYLVHTFGNKAITKIKEKTTLYIHILFNAVEAEIRNNNNFSESGHSRIDGIEEAANKMVDSIIGEQVARWIK